MNKSLDLQSVNGRIRIQQHLLSIHEMVGLGIQKVQLMYVK